MQIMQRTEKLSSEFAIKERFEDVLNHLLVLGQLSFALSSGKTCVVFGGGFDLQDLKLLRRKSRKRLRVNDKKMGQSKCSL